MYRNVMRHQAGAVTIIVMVGAPRLTRRVPAAILALAAGVLAYFGLSLFDPALLVVEGNRLIVGPLGGGAGSGGGGSTCVPQGCRRRLCRCAAL